MSKVSRKHNTFTAFVAMLPVWLLAILCASVLCDCKNNSADTPRRKAYPRIVTHDSSFVAVANAPLHFEISDFAQITLDTVIANEKNEGTRWLNVYYSQYNATIHSTFTPVDDSTIDDILENRSERMALNAGNHTSELLELTNANGFASQILVTEESNTTPLQFISTDNKKWVVSGALYLNGESKSNVDSIRPVINVIKRDIIHSLKMINKP